jgi:hypothetical protein
MKGNAKEISPGDESILARRKKLLTQALENGIALSQIARLMGTTSQNIINLKSRVAPHSAIARKLDKWLFEFSRHGADAASAGLNEEFDETQINNICKMLSQAARWSRDTTIPAHTRIEMLQHQIQAVQSVLKALKPSFEGGITHVDGSGDDTAA